MEDTHYIIGIAGGSGSGKTTFVKKLREHFNPEELCVLSLDNYYIPREEQKTDSKGIKNFDLPQSIDANALKNDIETLKTGAIVTKDEYLFNNEKAESKRISIVPAPIIIIEGLFIYHYEQLKALFNLRIFIHAKDNIKLIRRIKRDRTERNYPLEDVIYRYENHVLPSFEKYIDVYKNDCDIVVNNNRSLEGGLEVVKNFIKVKHQELAP